MYLDAVHETLSAQGYAQYDSSTGQWDILAIVGPISITTTDQVGHVTGQIQATYSGTVVGLATATISQSDYTAWTSYQYANDRLVSMRVYHDIPASGVGQVDTNYDQTSYGYENFGVGDKGRQNETVSADGTITREVLDARGNVLETWIGTDDYDASDADPSGGVSGQSGGNNMVEVASYTYNADGAVTQTRTYFGSGTNDYYATNYQYDWRDRQTNVLSPGNVVTHYDYDNLGDVTWTKTYASSAFTPDSDELRAETENLYDNLDQIYESNVYEVEQQDAQNRGTVGDYLPTDYWYDGDGNVIKTQTGAGPFTKIQYDGLGLPVVQYVGYDLDETTADLYDEYGNAQLALDGDTIVQQNQTWFDQAGEAVATATYERLPDDTTTTGALSAADSYATAAVTWYDGLGRTVATANYGREDVGSGVTHYFFDGSTGALIDTNADGIPDVAEAAPPQPYTAQNQSSMAGIDFQLQLIEYDSAGQPYQTIDSLGRIDKTLYDAAGGIVRTIQNFDGLAYGTTGSGFDNSGNVLETDTDKDITVDYQYASGDRLVTMTAYDAMGSGNGVQQEATRYLYGSTINASWQTGVVYPDSTDVLSQDSTTNLWTITTDTGDHTSTTYDRLGRTTSTTDERGVEHDYTFDTAGRLSADTVNLTGVRSGQNVDDSVLRIGTTYDDMGRVLAVTSYSDTAGTAAVNQVVDSYDGWGNLIEEVASPRWLGGQGNHA